MGAALFYKLLDTLVEEHLGKGQLYRPLCCIEPDQFGKDRILATTSRKRILDSFFLECLEIFREVLLDGPKHPAYDLLFNDTIEGHRLSFHRAIPSELFHPPRFFRTDEAYDGEIFEIQCPGSGWGDLSLLADVYGQLPESSKSLGSFSPAKQFAQDIVDLLGDLEPNVLHLLDNSSSPFSMKYQIHRSRPDLRYWGFDSGFKTIDCGFIRSHSFFGLVSENLFRQRVEKALDGKCFFDLPPIVLFDQKAPLALPFWDATRDRFSDEVRSALVYSYPITPEGFRDQDGEWISIDEFCNRPKSLRAYFAKYAGSDVTINWGSRSVEDLSKSRCRQLLGRILSDFSSKRFWIIQPAISAKSEVSYYGLNQDSPVKTSANVKVSTFYGPSGVVGIKTMYRSDNKKVHGQPDTIIGLGTCSG